MTYTMETKDKNYNRRIEGHPEPKEISEHYEEQAEAPVVPPVVDTAEPAAAKEGAGAFGWAAVAALGAAFVVGAIYFLSGWGSTRQTPAAREMAIATAAAPDISATDAATGAIPEENLPELTVTPNETPDAVYLFPLDGSAITENEDLNRVAREVKESGADVNVIAYTDESGRADYNQRLSERRAKAVGDYLIAHGVAAEHVHTQGNGQTHAYPTNAQDRRAEIHIVS